MTHDGGCACGAIRFRVSGEPAAVLLCACRDCRRASGGAPAHVLTLDKNQVEILRGRPRAYWSFADSGARVGRHYCETCATPLFLENAARRDIVQVRVGALDDCEPFAPQAVMWTKSAPGWMHFDAELVQFEGEIPEKAAVEGDGARANSE